jgi:hypothetical protein
MLETRRTKPAIRTKCYSLGEFYTIIDLMFLRLVYNSTGAATYDSHIRSLREIIYKAKLKWTFSDLSSSVIKLCDSGHIKFTSNKDVMFDIPSVSKKDRKYMLAMPEIIKDAANRIMQPYTVLDRIAVAIPTSRRR